MTPQILKWLYKVKKEYGLHDYNILELGSRNINGSPRRVFLTPTDDIYYLGVDMEEGDGVDLVLNAHDLVEYFRDELHENGILEDILISTGFGLVICCEMLEHDDKFWITLENINTVIASGGYLIITTPTYGFPYHGYPNDYYRFTEDTYRDVLFEGYEILELEKVRDGFGNPCIVCLGRKNG